MRARRRSRRAARRRGCVPACCRQPRRRPWLRAVRASKTRRTVVRGRRDVAVGRPSHAAWRAKASSMAGRTCCFNRAGAASSLSIRHLPTVARIPLVASVRARRPCRARSPSSARRSCPSQEFVHREPGADAQRRFVVRGLIGHTRCRSQASKAVRLPHRGTASGTGGRASARTRHTRQPVTSSAGRSRAGPPTCVTRPSRTTTGPSTCRGCRSW